MHGIGNSQVESNTKNEQNVVSREINNYAIFSLFLFCVPLFVFSEIIRKSSAIEIKLEKNVPLNMVANRKLKKKQHRINTR